MVANGVVARRWTMVRATRRDAGSSPYAQKRSASAVSSQVLTISAAVMPLRIVEAHIERPVVREGEAARRRRQLEGGEAEIEQDGRDAPRLPANAVGRLRHRREVRLPEHQPRRRIRRCNARPRAMASGSASSARTRAVRRGRFEQRARMPAAAERAVDHPRARLRREQRERLVLQHRNMTAADTSARSC